MSLKDKCCLKCGKVTYVEDALFCPYCGGSLINKKEFCLRTLRDILQSMYSSGNIRNDIIYDIHNCIDYIKEIGDENND